METSVLLVVTTCLFFATLGIIAWRLTSGVTDFVMLALLVFALFYGFRAILLASGLDSPFPERFFDLDQAATQAAVTQLWLTAFLACAGIGIYVTSELVPTKQTLFFARQVPPSSRMVAVTLFLTALATLISLFMIAKFGGVGPFIRAVKIEKNLAGLYFLKVPAAMGALLAVSTFVQLRNSPRAAVRRGAFPMLACGILNGFSVFIWGQRSALVIVGVLLVLATLGTRPQTEERRPGASALRAVVSLVVVVLIVIGVSSGLRVARDTLVAGEVQDVVADATFARQISIATNSIYFDSSMLAFRDWPDEHPYHMGEDFALSAGGFVPRIIWSGKPKTVVAGRWFRQVYQPNIVNGWPIGAPTLWWINFGPLGIFIGGLITGLVFGAIRRMQLNSARSSLNIAVALITAVYVFQTGVGPEWPVYFMSWLAPLWLIVWFVTYQPKDAPVEPEPEPVTSGSTT